MSEATSDMEMMTEGEEVIHPSPLPQNDDSRNLIALARQLLHQGNPSQSLQAVVMAMRAKGGEQAVHYILERARELYRSKLQASAEANQLASLFAECVIAEAQPSTSEPSPSPSFSMPPTHTLESKAGENAENSILAETGRKQIVLDAFCDGSSFICLQCGGLVSNHRKDEHYAYWCQF